MLPKLENVSRRRATVPLVKAVFFVTVLVTLRNPSSAVSDTKTSRQERRARSVMIISPGDYGRGKGNTIREILEIIVRGIP